MGKRRNLDAYSSLKSVSCSLCKKKISRHIEDHFCYGCGKYICHRCDGAQVVGTHSLEDHRSVRLLPVKREPLVSKSFLKSGKRKPLTFKRFQEVNFARAQHFFDHNVDSWSLAEWTNALAGEVGELCNFTKKMLRGDGDFTADCGKEIGDIITYTFLVADKLGIMLEQVLVEKFNEISDRIDKKNSRCKECGNDDLCDSVSGAKCKTCKGLGTKSLPHKPKAPRL